ncbi:MAG: 3-phosphoglycerate dehydrogenase [Chitinivibrionales bacterium]|nr:3-phosphoglycerate dehydrogenase [Chitinivibrionales bacterium]
MLKIQTLNKISSAGLDLLPRDEYDVASELLNPDAILVRSAKMHDMKLATSLKAIARAGAGVNNIPVDACSQKGIVVFNTPGANANGVKELAIAGMIISSRNIIDGAAWAKTLSGKGDEVPKLVEKGKSNFAGCEIMGKKLGVIGLGAIGVMVANTAIGLGMEVSGYDPFISVEAAWGLSRSVKRASSLEMLLAESDYISLHCPLTDDTRGLLGKEKFSAMKKGVRILNFARGGLVQNGALKEALAQEIVLSYVTDFPDEELLEMEKVVSIPHLGASTGEAENNCAVMAVTQVKEYLLHGNITNSVNFPNCSLAPARDKRIIVANENVPNMVGQITSVLAKEKLNIGEMLNKSRGPLAYNIIDVDGDVPDTIVEQLQKIQGAIMVRVL